MSSANSPCHIGEIVVSANNRFTAVCPDGRLYEPPALGTFLRTPPRPALLESPPREADPFEEPAPFAFSNQDPDAVFAVAGLASTSAADQGRRPAAYGLPEERLKAEQPQIYELLQTAFEAIPIATLQKGRLRHVLPDRPPRLHAFVEICEADEICALTQSPDFLRPLLIACAELGTEDLLVAALQCAWRARKNNFEYLVRMGKHLAHLLREEPDRLTTILRKLEP